MKAADRLDSEQAFHDRQACQRAMTFARQPDALWVDDRSYLSHETWIRPALNQLGDVQSKDVLDYGCGHAMASVVLARRGARVTAFDISGGYLSEATRRAKVNGVGVRFVQADGARLPFDTESFDRVWGNAVLHHLDVIEAGRELRRVLRPGGIAVFCEPWGGNPLLNLARRRWDYPGKERTPDEQPLRLSEVRALRDVFSTVEVQGVQLLSMARRVLRAGRLVAALDWCDAQLLHHAPWLGHWCRYVILRLHRQA